MTNSNEVLYIIEYYNGLDIIKTATISEKTVIKLFKYINLTGERVQVYVDKFDFCIVIYPVKKRIIISVI